MNSATKVGEIFTAAGQAFNKLGELTMQLPTGDTIASSQIRQTLKKKAFEEAGIPVIPVQQQVQQHIPAQQVLVKAEEPCIMGKNAEVMMTLNQINTQESEVDVEELSGHVKLEFESGHEEVAG
uniref:Putative chromatin complex subunit bap18 isoform x3 n=1 Tax=Nyssomyia neivai TaxID=330878 RepID=A0A1L8DWI0_9DIPT